MSGQEQNIINFDSDKIGFMSCFKFFKIMTSLTQK